MKNGMASSVLTPTLKKRRMGYPFSWLVELKIKTWATLLKARQDMRNSRGSLVRIVQCRGRRG